MSLRSFLAELKRRRVFRVAAAYVVVAFALLQAADIILPALNLPHWTITLVVVLAFVGFPIALLLAWAFDITPDGVARTEERRSGEEPPATRRSPTGWGAQRMAAAGGVLVLALAGGAFVIFGGSFERPLGPATEPERSIAVLPFANLTAEQENAFFASGVHEEVLTQLSKISDLRVISRASVLQYEPGHRDLRAIAGELDVATVLEGSVQRAGDRVRISVQLIDARSDRHLWAERYDRELTDIFAIQSEVALEIASALRASLTADERARLARRPTENLAAYDLFLRGTQLYAQSREQNETAIELFRQAIRLDPAFAVAHASLGSAYMQRVQTYGFPAEWADSGIVMAQRALEIDPDLAAGYNALGSNLSQLGRLRESQAAMRRAVELDPNHAGVLIGLSLNGAVLGLVDEAMRAARRSQLVDPTSPYPSTHLAWHSWTFGDDERAERWLHQALEIRPAFHWAEAMSLILDASRGREPQALARARARVDSAPNDFLVLMSAGDAALLARGYAEAVAYFERLVHMFPHGRNVPHQHSFRGSFAFALLMTGQQERAAQLFEQALAQARQEIDAGRESPGLPFEIATIHIARGEKAAAYEWLERAYAAGWRHSRLTRLTPMLESLHGEERFERLLARMDADLAAQRARLEREGAW